MNHLTFTERDEFKRRNIAEKTIKLLDSAIDLSPMVIDGGWGTGKTEFCLKLIDLMKTQDGDEKSRHLVYIDAFQADHANEPLLTILSEIVKLIPLENERRSFIEKVKPVMRYGLKASGKAFVSHLFKQDAVEMGEELETALAGVTNKIIDESVNALIKDHVEAQKNLDVLKSAIKELSSIKPIIIFIDELDRCRPDYSVTMLEVIKHTFNVEGVKFVLITNTQQLKAAIKNTYGSEIDAARYLNKFLKFSITLPEVVTSSQTNQNLASIEHYKLLVSKSSVLDNTDLYKDSDLNFIARYIRVQNLSLREVETLVRHIEIYHVQSDKTALTSNMIWGYRLLRLFGVVVATFHSEVAASIVKGRADAKELGRCFGVTAITDLKPEDSHYPTHHQVVLAMLGKECFYNSDSFTPSEGYSESEWSTLFRDYFGRSTLPSSLEVARKAINALNLLD